jgi:hypothetical protein
MVPAPVPLPHMAMVIWAIVKDRFSGVDYLYLNFSAVWCLVVLYQILPFPPTVLHLEPVPTRRKEDTALHHVCHRDDHVSKGFEAQHRGLHKPCPRSLGSPGGALAGDCPEGRRFEAGRSHHCHQEHRNLRVRFLPLLVLTLCTRLR